MRRSGCPRALMQAVPDCYIDATVEHLSDGRPIDLGLARMQHAAVVEGMEWLGFDVVVLGPDGAGPDGVFVEDPAVIHEGVAVILQSAHPVRMLEAPRIETALGGLGIDCLRMTGQARMDGGDVMIVDRTVFVGLSARTNLQGAEQLALLLDLDLRRVELPGGVLHLKCVTSPLGGGRVLATPEIAKDLGLPAVIAPAAEAYAANVVAHEGRVLCAEGYPRTARALTEAGYEVRLLDLSEIRRGDGSITCLSLRMT